MNQEDKQNKQTATFEELGLSKSILLSLKKQDYKVPSPIQRETIPYILKGKDVMAASQTGTGKTAAFVLPLLHKLEEKSEKLKNNTTKILILAPTRELAKQIDESIQTYGQFLQIKSTAVFGGVKINPQMLTLTQGVNILVATPGRLLDLHRKNAIQFNELEVLVLDEADRMLNLGFEDELAEIMALIPKKRQNLLFTATFTEEVRLLAKEWISDPVEITIAPEIVTPDEVNQWIIPVDKIDRPNVLIKLLEDHTGKKGEKVLIFVKTKNKAEKIVRRIRDTGLMALAIHGDKSQGSRTTALKELQHGTVKILVATDLAARGLDIELLPLIINYDLPHLKEDYIHRIGRTGRAGAKGEAISFVSREDFHKLRDIERLTKQVLERRIMEGFEPKEILRESILNTKPFPLKKPKKKKKKRGD